jgi:Na+(H+)/acetate symporter ActP
VPALPLAAQTLPLAIVGALVLATLGLTAFAHRINKDTGDHYVAGRRIGGLANGLALAGDRSPPRPSWGSRARSR